MLSGSIDHLRVIARLTTATAVVIVIVLLGLPSAAPSLMAPSVARGATHVVDVGDGFFSPTSLTVTVGDTVTWTNVDDSPHTATAAGAFDSGNLDAGQSFSYTFSEAGTFSYVCLYHEEMVATITVVAASVGSPQAPAPASAAPGAPVASPESGSQDGQPDTALPVSTPLTAAWIAPLLIGLGLLAFGVGLLPTGTAEAAHTTSPARRRPGSGWRR